MFLRSRSQHLNKIFFTVNSGHRMDTSFTLRIAVLSASEDGKTTDVCIIAHFLLTLYSLHFIMCFIIYSKLVNIITGLSRQPSFSISVVASSHM